MALLIFVAFVNFVAVPSWPCAHYNAVMQPAASPLLVYGFIALPVALVLTLAFAVRHAGTRLGERPSRTRGAVVLTIVAGAAWMTVSALAAASGVLREWSATPPPMAGLILGMLTLACSIALTGYGQRLAQGMSLAMLVGFHAFRLPLELLMHRAAAEGVMPEVMTYTGRNLDILTGASAIVVALLLASGYAGQRTAVAWNVAGLALLVNVVVVSILATPRFRVFGDDQLNVWVTYVPFVWLPAVMVTFALAGHLVVFRALRSASAAMRPARVRG